MTKTQTAHARNVVRFNVNRAAGKMMIAPNGMNLSRSITRPNSRLNRVLDYLYVVGPSSKEKILRDVFQKNIAPYGTFMVHEVTRGWGAYLFTLAVNHGYIRKVRTGNAVKYHLNVKL